MNNKRKTCKITQCFIANVNTPGMLMDMPIPAQACNTRPMTACHVTKYTSFLWHTTDVLMQGWRTCTCKCEARITRFEESSHDTRNMCNTSLINHIRGQWLIFPRYLFYLRIKTQFLSVTAQVHPLQVSRKLKKKLKIWGNAKNWHNRVIFFKKNFHNKENLKIQKN